MLEKVPTCLKESKQWVLWRAVGDERRKTPFQVDGSHAKANDPTTWRDFASCAKAYQAAKTKYDGLGFEFSHADPFVGVDLDNCRETNGTADWARKVLERFNTYTEVSPSGHGFKLWCRGKSPFATGKRIEIDGEQRLEVYDRGRYFAVTGQRVGGLSPAVEDRGDALAWLGSLYAEQEKPWRDAPKVWDDDEQVLTRARLYVGKIPGAIAGAGGHNATYHVSCVLVRGFMLSAEQSLAVMCEWNARCDPPWSERDLQHKIDDAAKAGGQSGWLRGTAPEHFEAVKVPVYVPPKPPVVGTLSAATRAYVDELKRGRVSLMPLGLPDLDHAIGDGVEPGEVVVFAARPGHGKSAAALNVVHYQTAMNRASLFVTLEMSSRAIGKRTLQYMSELPEYQWLEHADKLETERDRYFQTRAECYLLEDCTDPRDLARHVDEHVQRHGVEIVCVDYAQLMHGKGGTRYEQVSDVSRSLREIANRSGVVMVVLCQLNRNIESRDSFVPRMSDIRDSGQIEQDADVVVFLSWPCKVDANEDPEKYQMWVAKNRNRETRHSYVECRFNASQQKLFYAASEMEVSETS